MFSDTQRSFATNLFTQVVKSITKSPDNKKQPSSTGASHGRPSPFVWIRYLPVYVDTGRKPGSRNRPRPRFLIPEGLLEALRDGLPGFAAQDEREQRAAAHLLDTRYLTGRYIHQIEHDCFYVGYNTLNRLFGSNKFKPFNTHVKLFAAHTYRDMGISDLVSAFTHAYRPTDVTLRALEQYLDATEATNIIDQDGRRLQKVWDKGVIPSRDKTGNRAARAIEIDHFVPVNLAAIHNAAATLQQKLSSKVNDRQESARWERIRTQLCKIRRLANNSVVHGSIPQTYLEAESGRIYGQDFHLQTVHREAKRIALAGSWEYDFANCQFAIFAQLAEQAGYIPAVVGDYLAHKKEIRHDMAAYLGESLDTVKQILLAFLYGAQFPTRWSKRSSLLQFLHGAWEKISKLSNHRFARALPTDIKQGCATILQNLA